MKIYNMLTRISLKSRLRILLLVSSILPIMLIWLFTSMFTYNLYKQNTDDTIKNEINLLQSNVETIMENIKHVSQQFSNDDETVKDLRRILNGSSIERVNSMKSLQKRIAVYEISNPYIGSTTYFYLDDGEIKKINNSLLSKNELPSPNSLLSTQNKLSYYGPHKTLSAISDYYVISMVRKLPLVDMPEIFIYIESGYRQMDAFSTVTLDRMKSVYSIISTDDTVVYSSDHDILPIFSKAPDTNQGSIKLDKERYLPYNSTSNVGGWKLQVFVPTDEYFKYTTSLSLGFIVVAILTATLSLLLAGALWNSVNRPFKLFDQNLKNIMTNDITANLKTINVSEFDKNFEYFEKMKKRIVRLIEEAQRQEQEKSQLEIKQLLSKINPHFIHNTLDTLKWYSKRQQYNDVESFVSSLNRLLMYNMEKDKKTTIKSELSAIDDYIALQKYKYNLDYSKEIDLPSQMLLSEMPRFVLQPIVENAIFHGIEGNGKIGIRAKPTSSGKILIQIYNDGLPMDLEKMEDILKSASDLSSNGIGLQYVVKMLESAFPNEYDFRFSTENGENRIEMVIPFFKGDYYAKNLDS